MTPEVAFAPLVYETDTVVCPPAPETLATVGDAVQLIGDPPHVQLGVNRTGAVAPTLVTVNDCEAECLGGTTAVPECGDTAIGLDPVTLTTLATVPLTAVTVAVPVPVVMASVKVTLIGALEPEGMLTTDGESLHDVTGDTGVQLMLVFSEMPLALFTSVIL